jgi:uncharacterized protein YgiM (DUF1202 family)
VIFSEIMKIFHLIILLIIFSVAVFAQTVIVITDKANLRGTPNQDGIVVTEVSLGEEFELIKQQGSWFLVQTPKYVGWLHGNTIKLGTTYRAGQLELIRGELQDVTPKRKSTKTKTSKTRTQSFYYQLGERGGCYYINSNGNKTYVDRSLCN